MVKNAYSLTECIITLSLIGILAITMISLNKFNEERIAQMNMDKVDTALKAWGKEVIKTDEMGLGATSKITDQATLVNSLSNYFNTSTPFEIADPFYDTDGNKIVNAQKIKLDNGTSISIKYMATGPQEIRIGNQIFRKNLYESNLIIIKVDIPARNGKIKITEQYGLRGNKIIEYSRLYSS